MLIEKLYLKPQRRSRGICRKIRRNAPVQWQTVPLMQQPRPLELNIHHHLRVPVVLPQLYPTVLAVHLRRHGYRPRDTSTRLGHLRIAPYSSSWGPNFDHLHMWPGESPEPQSTHSYAQARHHHTTTRALSAFIIDTNTARPGPAPFCAVASPYAARFFSPQPFRASDGIWRRKDDRSG